MVRFVVFLALIGSLSCAQEAVEIRPGVVSVTVEDANGKRFTIQREQKPDSYLTNTYALTSRPSPPFYIQPFQVEKGVETYGELELLEFLQKKKGMLVDSRLPNWYIKSAIPTAINLPFKIYLSENPLRDDALRKMGVKKKKDGTYDFSGAKTVLFYCNGAWCGQSPTAIRALIKLGYPKNKMKYYRGGMQAWQLLGFTTIVPDPATAGSVEGLKGGGE